MCELLNDDIMNYLLICIKKNFYSNQSDGKTGQKFECCKSTEGLAGTIHVAFYTSTMYLRLR